MQAFPILGFAGQKYGCVDIPTDFFIVITTLEFHIDAQRTKYSDPHLVDIQRVRDIATLIPKWDISLKSILSELRELCRRGGGNKSE